MSPFKGAISNEAVQQMTKEKTDEEELAAQMKELDYSECYCHALNHPPWGGYSIEEQILHEVKQRKRSIGQVKSQEARRSRYSYRYANNAFTGEIFIHDPFIDQLLSTTGAKLDREPIDQPGSTAEDTQTGMLGSVDISNPTEVYTPRERLEELPEDILRQVISYLDPYELGSLSEASRCLTILIGLVPCRDAFKWAVRRCQVYGHARQDSLCGDCVHAFEKRIE